MFQVKNFEAITASIINNIIRMSDDLTDFNVGSKIRTMIEAEAHEIDQYYQELLKGLLEAIPYSIYKSFNFGRLAASPASGYATFTRTPDTTNTVKIPKGTKVKVPNTDLIFTTTATVKIEGDEETVDAFVVATSPGKASNAAAETVTEIADTINNLRTVTNVNAFTNGRNEETDQERKRRFQRWVTALSRGTRSALRYGALTTQVLDKNGLVKETVQKVRIFEPCIDADPPGEPGHVVVYIWNGTTGASADLLVKCEDVLKGYTDEDGKRVAGWKGAGITVDVEPVAPTPVNIAATLTLDTGLTVADVREEIISLLDVYFDGLEVEEKVIKSKFVDIIMGVSGVIDVSVTSPVGNVQPTAYHIAKRGTVTLT